MKQLQTFCQPMTTGRLLVIISAFIICLDVALSTEVRINDKHLSKTVNEEDPLDSVYLPQRMKRLGSADRSNWNKRVRRDNEQCTTNTDCSNAVCRSGRCAACTFTRKLITFDDITFSGVDESLLPGNYQQLQWSSGHVVRAGAYPGTGYSTALQSSPNVGFNGNRNPIEITRSNGQPFTVTSFYMAAAFEDTVTMTFTGYYDSVQVQSVTQTITKAAVVLVTLNWVNINRFRLSPSPAAYFAIENMDVTLCDLALPTVPSPDQILITFDDVTISSGDETALPTSYQQLQWSNTHVVRAGAYPTSGYAKALQSSPNVGFNGDRNPIDITRSSGQLFTVNSFYISAAFESSVTMTFTGYLNNAQVYSSNYIISNANVILVTLNWANIDKFSLSPSSVAYFAIDNLYVTLVEPSFGD